MGRRVGRGANHRGRRAYHRHRWERTAVQQAVGETQGLRRVKPAFARGTGAPRPARLEQGLSRFRRSRFASPGTVRIRTREALRLEHGIRSLPDLSSLLDSNTLEEFWDGT